MANNESSRPDPVYPLGGEPRAVPALDAALRHLRTLVASSPAIVRDEGPFDPVSVCFFCGATLSHVAHDDACAWWRARVFLLDGGWTDMPDHGGTSDSQT